MSTQKKSLSMIEFENQVVLALPQRTVMRLGFGLGPGFSFMPSFGSSLPTITNTCTATPGAGGAGGAGGAATSTAGGTATGGLGAAGGTGAAAMLSPALANCLVHLRR